MKKDKWESVNKVVPACSVPVWKANLLLSLRHCQEFRDHHICCRFLWIIHKYKIPQKAIAPNRFYLPQKLCKWDDKNTGCKPSVFLFAVGLCWNYKKLSVTTDKCQQKYKPHLTQRKFQQHKGVKNHTQRQRQTHTTVTCNLLHKRPQMTSFYVLTQKEVKRSSQVYGNTQGQEKKQSAHKHFHSGHAKSIATFSHHACIIHMLIPMTSNAIKLFFSLSRSNTKRCKHEKSPTMQTQM